MHMQIMEHILVNGSVHTACKQHQRVQMCFRLLCERGLNNKELRILICFAPRVAFSVDGASVINWLLVPFQGNQKPHDLRPMYFRWKSKCKKLEQSADRSDHVARQTTERNEQLVKETETLRHQVTSGSQQVAALRREMEEMLAWKTRVHEGTSSKDNEVQLLKNASNGHLD